jgi:cytochrome c-type biogenesis protein CcmH
VARGSTDAEVRQYMVDRYGQIILLRPQWSLANSWLWLAPGLFLVGGILVAWRVLRQRRVLLATDYAEVDADVDDERGRS